MSPLALPLSPLLALSLALSLAPRPVARIATPARRATLADSTLSAFARAKAERLLRERLPCLGCHKLGDEGGRIGPDLSDVAARRPASYIAAMVSDPQRTLPGTLMPRTPMPEAMRTLVVRYLETRGGPSGSAGAGSPPAAKDATTPEAAPNPNRAPVIAASQPVELRGDVLYARHCAACHGASGNGDGPNARYLPVKPAVHASREAMSLRPDDTLFDAIAGGGLIVGKSARMPAFGETLTHAQIRALVRHIRTLCRCQGPAWSSAASH